MRFSAGSVKLSVFALKKLPNETWKDRIYRIALRRILFDSIPYAVIAHFSDYACERHAARKTDDLLGDFSK